MTLTAVFLHGFGQRYDLPISLALYLYSAAGVVVLSFVIVGALSGDRVGERAVHYPSWPVPVLSRLARAKWPRILGGLIGVLALATIVVTGIFGTQNPTINPSEYLLWIYFWAGLVIVSGVVGNLWAYLNPFSAIHSVLARWVEAPPAELPPRLGIWPAVALYFGFAFLELASGVANRPVVIGASALAYTLFTLAGMLLVGREAWLSRVEFVTVLFDLVGRFSPVERSADGVVRLRPWGVGLLRPYPGGWDRIAFVILTLSTLAFDGITATSGYQQLLVSSDPFFRAFGAWQSAAFRGVSLLALTVVFLLVFSAITWFVIFFGAAKVRTLPTMTAFALTLIPIALVYNAAHNYSYLVIQGQALPMAFENAFSSGPPPPFVASFALANAAVVWYVQVALIVVGHVIAVFLAHMRAGERFKTATSALLSQYPMLILMVAYTITSLTILAQPTTRGG